MSVFWWGLMLILIFSVTLGWTPVAGRIGALYDIHQVTGFYLIDVWFSENSLKAFGSALGHLTSSQSHFGGYSPGFYCTHDPFQLSWKF